MVEKHCCGVCMHMIPRKRPNITNNKIWKCDVTHRTVYFDDGMSCKKFDNKYSDGVDPIKSEKLREWFYKVNHNSREKHIPI